MSEFDAEVSLDPGDDPDLRAERVQDEEAAGRALAAGAVWRWEVKKPPAAGTPAPSPEQVELEQAHSAAARVAERLKHMPGWSLAAGGHAIDRVRSLPSAFGAADYGTLVLREAARTRQNVRIGLIGSQVVVTVMAPRQGRERGAIGASQLDFAAGLV